MQRRIGARRILERAANAFERWSSARCRKPRALGPRGIVRRTHGFELPGEKERGGIQHVQEWRVRKEIERASIRERERLQIRDQSVGCSLGFHVLIFERRNDACSRDAGSEKRSDADGDRGEMRHRESATANHSRHASRYGPRGENRRIGHGARIDSKNATCDHGGKIQEEGSGQEAKRNVRSSLHAGLRHAGEPGCDDGRQSEQRCTGEIILRNESREKWQEGKDQKKRGERTRPDFAIHGLSAIPEARASSSIFIASGSSGANRLQRMSA
jgi:hypothetical protein